jgi:5S rRNA maturation endonuclease (ribonuclease M5)
MNWSRVSRKRRCLVCGRGDWCTFNERGSGCMRVESPVQMRNGGWWHPNNLSGGVGTDTNEAQFHEPSTRRRNDAGESSVPPAQTLDCDALLRKWQQSQNGQLEPFAATLGVSQQALRALGCVWAGDHRAFAFLMVDAQRSVIGIRLRNERGEKWAVKGSRSGLFMNLSAVPVLAEPKKAAKDWTSRPDTSEEPRKGQPGVGEARESTDTTADTLKAGSDSRGGRQILIVEGPTDTAAAIDLGFAVIGRPACLGCEDMIVQVAKQYPRGRLFIIADADEPGQRGARKLQEKLRKAKVVTLPAKDLREFVQLGGTKKLLNELLMSAL